VFALFRSPIAKLVGYVLLITSFLAGAYIFVDSRATARAESACELAATVEQNLLLTAAIHSAQEAHQFTLAEIERGEKLSAELAKTQRRLSDTKTEYLAYANGITGNCPADLGRVLMPYPAPSDSGEASEDSATSAPTDPAATVAASLIAGNIAENRWRFDSNYAQCTALFKWHQEGPVK
jgi:hypothetical protein